MTYFSERERGERPRNVEEIDEVAWGGIRALIAARISDGSFGATYAESCLDGYGPIGTDDNAFWLAMRAEIPNLEEPPWYGASDELPTTLDILDMIEFCCQAIGKPIRGGYHKFFSHYHLSFDIETGRTEFCSAINKILRRNGLAYHLTDEGRIERLAPPVLREALASVQFDTGDPALDQMLEAARNKLLNPDLIVRTEALEKLWDAWERLKTIDTGNNKKAGIARLLDLAAGSGNPILRMVLEEDATSLTQIGNKLQIRHSETTQEPITKSEHVDYLFHRMFAAIELILRSRAN